MAYTEGPWEIRAAHPHLPSLLDRDCGIVDGKGYIIAEVFAKVGAQEYRDAQMNASLIAAAPDLLDACQVALKNLLYLQETYPDDYNRICDAPFAVLVQKLTEAIAKAEGKATA